MSQHKGITDAEGMISDMAEGSGSGPWRSDFPDDSDFGVDGSGSGDGYSGEFGINTLLNSHQFIIIFINMYLIEISK